MKLKHYISEDSSRRGRIARTLGVLAIAATGIIVVPAAVPAASAGPLAERASMSIDPLGVLADFALSLMRGEADSPGSGDYAGSRDAVAAAIATRLGIDPAELQVAWAAADLEHQQALLTGLTQLGVPYRRNSSKVGEGFDCSGLTTYAWAGAGVALVRQSGAQIRAAAPRTIETAQAGDLMQYPGHIMMWLGVGRAVLQSPSPGRTVEVVLYKAGRRVRVGDPAS